jgi:arsenate reductase
MSAPPRVLFLCIENSCRSQMAEALGRLAGLTTFSAGSRPSGQVHPGAVAALAERGYDMRAHRSQSAQEFLTQRFDAVICMGCGDDCPGLFADLREDWDIPDPKREGPEGFRRVRDEIARRVDELRARIGEARLSVP